MVTLVLKDDQNRVIRSYLLDDENTHELIRNNETSRIDVVKTSAPLVEDKIDFTLLEKFSVRQLKAPGLRVDGRLTLARLEENQVAVIDQQLPKEDQETAATALKWSTVSHLALLAIIILSGWIINRYFSPVEENQPMEVVVLPPPEPEIKKLVPERKKTVKVMEQVAKPVAKTPIQVPKVQRQVPVRRQLVKRVAIKARRNVGPSSGVVKGPTEIGSLKTLEKLGGIGASTQGATKGTGSGKSRLGAFGSGQSFGGGLGAGTEGGIKNALGGKGLVAGLSGDGSQAYGASGYGENRFGGGYAGRGGGGIGKRIGSVQVPDFKAVYEDAEIMGGLTREQVESVVRRHQGQLAYCYEKALQTQSKLRGRINSRWVIDGNGTVVSVKTAGNSLRSPEIENCVKRSISKWKFPHPVGGVRVDVSYPFDFGRLNMMATGG